MEQPLSIEEQVAASAVAALGAATLPPPNKRSRDAEDSPDVGAGIAPANKISRSEDVGPSPLAESEALCRQQQQQQLQQDGKDLQPFPFFFYRDLSTQKDPDPLTPLTAPGRVPNFPAKMHSILSRPDLADIICWMPHGRSWRVLKPREFEIRVIPTYFEHAKFSSFIRQANGWGFRRVTQGRDRNSYYHEMFLRGLPHLCKEMKRPGVAQKQAADPEHEPDLYKISELHPVPAKAEDDSILLQCTLQGGPKARMPIYSGNLRHNSSLQPLPASSTGAASTPVHMPSQQQQPALTPRDQQALTAFQQSLGASESQFKAMNFTPTTTPTTPVFLSPQAFMPPPAAAAAPQLLNNNTISVTNPAALANTTAASPSSAMTALIAANQLALNPFSHPASQFAAGFAAATAWSHQQFQTMMGQFAQQQAQQQQQVPQVSVATPTPSTQAVSSQSNQVPQMNSTNQVQGQQPVLQQMQPSGQQQQEQGSVQTHHHQQQPNGVQQKSYQSQDLVQQQALVQQYQLPSQDSLQQHDLMQQQSRNSYPSSSDSHSQQQSYGTLQQQPQSQQDDHLGHSNYLNQSHDHQTKASEFDYSHQHNPFYGMQELPPDVHPTPLSQMQEKDPFGSGL